MRFLRVDRGHRTNVAIAETRASPAPVAVFDAATLIEIVMLEPVKPVRWRSATVPPRSRGRAAACRVRAGDLGAGRTAMMTSWFWAVPTFDGRASSGKTGSPSRPPMALGVSVESPR